LRAQVYTEYGPGDVGRRIQVLPYRFGGRVMGPEPFLGVGEGAFVLRDRLPELSC